ncbi:triacylglycerol lipase [Aquirhabdus parva]|uniref:Triacylglycerol lipase n=2 Tax=Aquirhabdus parva TaxID=2283318 RepID=A0A345PBR0_9GAMM|nr:triacylglycerol lipase [Aquirhabdus parva]
MRYGMLASLVLSASGVTCAHAATITDPFYSYTDSKPLVSIPLGTVLKQRTVTYHLVGVPTAATAVQLLYRTNNAQRQPVVNVTSIILPAKSNGKAISYQSAYDSLNPKDSPSQVIAGDKDITKLINLGPIVYSGESIPLAALAALGYTIIVPDTQGVTADFAAGPEYGMTTLDSIRAVLNFDASTVGISSGTKIGLTASSKVAMIGYSGGAIGTGWAAQLAPTYAPEVNKQLVGAAFGGYLIDPIHNLDYVDGSILWGAVAPAALVGLSRAYDLDLTPYLNDKGLAVAKDIQDQSLAYILPRYLGLKFSSILKPEYATAWSNYLKTGTIDSSFKTIIDAANTVNAGSYGSPTIPIYYTQGSVGVLNGTFKPNAGDGVMLAEDARTLVRQFCKDGTKIQYTEVPFEHAATAGVWAVGMLPWLYDRFEGKKAPPSNCKYMNSLLGSLLLPGRSLAPVVIK